MKPLLTIRQVGVLLSHSQQWFNHHRARLEGEGFPKPVAGLGMRWDPVAIDGWLARQRGEAPPATQAAPASADILRWQAQLDANATRLGRVA